MRMPDLSLKLLNREADKTGICSTDQYRVGKSIYRSVTRESSRARGAMAECGIQNAEFGI